MGPGEAGEAVGAVGTLVGVCGLFVLAAVLLQGARRAVAGTLAVLCATGCGVLVAFGAAAPTEALPAPTATVSTAPSPSPSPSPSLLAAWGPRVVHTGAGYRGIPRWSLPVVTASAVAAGSAPAVGRLGSVVIPATVSHFRARPALVYLPPAALTGHPALLPVVIALSGQSRGAGPMDLFSRKAGDLKPALDAMARAHGGLAPIVVVPDQLGPASGNPMCVDSRALGHAATYVLRDVRSFVLTHLPVRTDTADWTVAGFSEGGTCAIQFAAGHPEDFGAVIDVSGEVAPRNGSLAHTIRAGFGGSRPAYTRASPAWLLAHDPVAGVPAYFAVGAKDHRYGPVATVMAARAARGGMDVHRLTVPGLGHDWAVGRAGLLWGIEGLAAHWGF